MAVTAKAATVPSTASTAVRNHVSAILMKLQVTDRTAAAIKARDAR